jgi:hypothetical protein
MKEIFEHHNVKYDELLSMSQNDIIDLMNKFKIAPKPKIHDLYIKKKEKEKESMQIYEKLVDLLVSNNEIEDLIVNFRNLFIEKILHQSLKLQE